MDRRTILKQTFSLAILTVFLTHSFLMALCPMATSHAGHGAAADWPFGDLVICTVPGGSALPDGNTGDGPIESAVKCPICLAAATLMALLVAGFALLLLSAQPHRTAIAGQGRTTFQVQWPDFNSRAPPLAA